jgi:hypothetical protein
MGGENGTAIRIELDLSDRGDAGAFHPKLETSDTAERAQVIQAHPVSPR